MISVVVPSYNRRDCVLRLLGNIFSQEDCDFEVIVVDDCSQDDTVEAIRREFPQVRLFVNEVNSGPCVTRNRGIRAAIGEIIVGFDSDVTVPDSHLLAKTQHAYAEYPNVSGFAFRIYLNEEYLDDSLRWWHPLPIDRGKNIFFETDYFSGTAYSFQRVALIESGLYLESLYMHYEEVELSLRIIDTGRSILYHPDLSAHHHACNTSRDSKILEFYKYRNQVLLAASCFPFVECICYMFPRILFNLFVSIKNRHFNEFMLSMKDAASKLVNSRIIRRPVTKLTLERIKKIRNYSNYQFSRNSHN